MRFGRYANTTFACCLALSFAVIGMVGCGGAPETAADFAAGSGGNPLDGGVISDDGATMTMEVGADGLERVSLEDGTGESTIGFARDTEGEELGVIEITTATGNSFSASDGIVRVTAQTPIGAQSLSFARPNPLQSSARRKVNQAESTCEDVRNSISDFCEWYAANGDSTQEEIRTEALAIAEEQLDASLVGLVAAALDAYLNDIFGQLDTYCEAWTELLAGSPPDVPAVDPCDS